MWPFKRRPSNSELLERIERLERRFLGLVEEWDDSFDRIRRAENRIKEKRAKIEEQTSQAADGANGTIEETPGGHSPLSFTPRQMEIQQAVLRRRAGRS